MLLFFIPVLSLSLLVGWVYTELSQKSPSVRITLGLANILMIGAIGFLAFQAGKVEPNKERAMLSGAIKNIGVLAKQGDTARIELIIKAYEESKSVNPGYASALKLYELSGQKLPSDQPHR